MQKQTLKIKVFPYFIRLVFIAVLLFFIGEGTFSEENKSVNKLSLITNNNLSPFLIKPLDIDFFLPVPLKYPQPVIKIELQHKENINFNEPSIVGDGKMSFKKLSFFLEKYNPKLSKRKARRIAKIYIEESKKENINWDVAFTQMCLETGYLTFGGDVKPGQNNFSGLGVVSKGVYGNSYSSIRLGIRAHIQHLKAYASFDKINGKIIDNRFRFVKRGCVKKLNDLSGTWAMDKNYGKKIKSLLHRLYALKSS